MSNRGKSSDSDGSLPPSQGRETRGPDPDGNCLLTLRAAVIFGTSLVAGILIGGLTWLAGPGHAAGLAAAAIAGLVACAGAVKSLNAIIAR